MNFWSGGLRLDDWQRIYKMMSAAGFRGIELIGGGFIDSYLNPMNGPIGIKSSFGTYKKFLEWLSECGIDKVVSFWLASHYGAVPTNWWLNPTNHEKLIKYAEPYVKLLVEVDGLRLVMMPGDQYYLCKPVTEEKIRNVAECFNKIAKMAADYGIETSMHNEFWSMIHSMEEIELFFKYASSEVGYCIDTAQVTIAGNNPVELYKIYNERVNHFHFKDTHNIDTKEEYKKEKAEFGSSVKRWFWEMGTLEGKVDFPALMTALKQRSYKGWIILESDQSPNPPESALLNRWYIDNVLSKIYS